MSIPASLQTLLLQFQNRYPQGGLCAELLTIHQNQYVVRALVQVGNMTVASAMAVATDLEAAEERAKLRALECLGVAAASPLSSPAPTLHVPSLNIPEAALSAAAQAPLPVGMRLNRLTELYPDPTELPEAPAELPEAASQLGLPPIVQPTPPLSASSITGGYSGPLEPAASALSDSGSGSNAEAIPKRGEASAPAEAEFGSSRSADLGATLPGALPDSLPNTLPDALPGASPSISLPSSVSTAVAESYPESGSSARAAKPERAAKRKAEPVPEPAAASVDRSQEVMRIGIEMKRLGWSTEQGREYLKRTYGKRSRQELDDAELLDFLHYLESQPSTLQAPF